MVEILMLHSDFVIIYKPSGVPSQPDPTGDADAMTLTAGMLAERGERSELYLIHRLDRNVGGILVLGRNKRGAAELSRLVREGEIKKEYLAVVKGIPEDGEYVDFLYRDSALNKSFAVRSERRGAKRASLTLSRLESARGDYGDISLCHIDLHTGRHHQIRTQLSSRGHSILGDGKYGGKDYKCKSIALFCYRLSFKYFNQEFTARIMPPSDYPWSLFIKISEEE